MSFVGLSKFETHLLFGSGFGFPTKRLAISSKVFKPMAALITVPAVGLSGTFDKLRKNGQEYVFENII